MKKNEQSLRETQDTIKQTNIHIVRVRKGEERGTETFLKKQCPKLPQIAKGHEYKHLKAQLTPSRRPTLRHIITKLLKDKDKDRILKAAREN